MNQFFTDGRFFDVAADTLSDSLKILPFLLVTYLFMELLERHTQDRVGKWVQSAGHFGPLFGGIFGVMPQCGFSAAASNLYAGRVITVGTLLAIYLSTSDEMLPLMISERVSLSLILPILAAKAVIGMIWGFLLDFAARKTRILRHRKVEEDFRIHEICEREHCHCEEEEGSILRCALVHAIHIFVFVLMFTFLLNLIVTLIGEDAIRGVLMGRPLLSHVFAGLIGLIPNCAASVIITELYLGGMISIGTMLSGLLVGAGIGLLVLYRVNPEPKKNLAITLILYACGVLSGALADLLL